MEMVFWAFMVWVGYSDGNVEAFNPSFQTQAECEEFRTNVPNYLTERAEEWGIVTATWDVECKEVKLYWHEDPRPLDPQSDTHSH